MNMQLAVKTLLRLIALSKEDNELITIYSSECEEFRFRENHMIPSATNVIMGIDDILTIHCDKQKIWFKVNTYNSPYELLEDYTDNETCRNIAMQFNEYFTQGE